MGLKNNKNIPADVRRTIVEELGHHTSVSVVHPCCFGNGYRWDWIEAWEYPNHLVLSTRKFFHTGQILLAIRETAGPDVCPQGLTGNKTVDEGGGRLAHQVLLS